MPSRAALIWAVLAEESRIAISSLPDSSAPPGRISGFHEILRAHVHKGGKWLRGRIFRDLGQL